MYRVPVWHCTKCDTVFAVFDGELATDTEAK